MRARMLLLALVLLCSLATAGPSRAATFNVGSSGDGADANPGNGVCATGGGSCTLRAAVQEANALGGTDAIAVPGFTIALGSSLTISSPITITGAGPDPSETLVDANGHQGFFVTGTGVRVRQLAITDGDAQGGGAMQVDGGAEVEITDARLFENSATTGGAALAVDEGATVEVLRTGFEDNSAIGGFGGAVWNAGELFVRDSLMEGNSSLRAGAIRNTGGAVLNLRNTTLSGNSALPSSSAGGGGLVNTGGSFAFLNNATLTLNIGRGVTAGNIQGGGLYTGDDSTTVVKNSVIAGNDDPFAPDDCVGPVSSDSRYNLLEDTDGCGLPAVTTTWILGEDPELGPLQSNGGPTRTHLPGFSSPLVDAGYPFPPGGPAADSCEADDQRGTERLLCDIGAVERQVSVPTQLNVNSTTDAVDALPGNATCATAGGVCSLRAAVMEANRLPGAQTIRVSAGTHGFSIPAAEGGFEPARGGDLDLTDDVTVEAVAGATPVVDANDLSRAFEVSPGTTATIRGLFLRDGTDTSGGGVRVTSGTLFLDDSTVATNVGSVSGGGIEADGLSPVLWVTDSTIRNNVASFSGGGGIESGGAIAVVNSVVRNNTAGGGGGGIRTIVSGSAAIVRTTVRNNSTTGGLGSGGGISGNGLTISESTVSANSAQTQGGGVFGTGTIENSTLSGNTTATSGGGASTNGTLTLRHVTVAANIANAGRGLHRFGSGSQLPVRNTILANPGGAECAGGAPTSHGDNIGSDGTCSLTAAGDLPSTNAQIAALGFYGGPTRTHRLLAGSPALDAAAAVGLATDQRGVARPVGPAPDIGAVEGTATFLSPLVFDSLLSLGPLVQGSLAVDLPRGTVRGDLLVVSVTALGGQAAVPAGWNLAARAGGQLVLWRIASGAQGARLVVGLGPGTSAAAGAAVGFKAQGAIDAIRGIGAATGRGDLASATVDATAGMRVIALQGRTGPRGAKTATPPEGWAELADGVDGSGQVQTSISAVTATRSGRLGGAVRLSGAGDWSLVVLGVRGRSR